MVLKTITDNLLSFDSKYPREFKKILNKFPDDHKLNQKQEKLLFDAYEVGIKAHSGQKRKSGAKYFDHCIAVCNQLILWNMDINTIVAGLLHDTIEDTTLSSQDLEKKFGNDITQLISGVSKLSGIKFRDNKHKQAENFMKMFLSLSQDLRVIIIKFADRLHNMKTIKYLPDNKQHRIAVETRELYAPLAHRLGMNNIKIQFEDLTFQVLDRTSYKDIRKKVKASYKQRDKHIKKFCKNVENELENYKIEAEVFGRAKHYYSIYKKMINKTKLFSELYDILAVRIIVDKTEECYSVLGIVHQLYTPIQNRFKDYIATPKSNGYKSIHTTVFTENGEQLEIQIRTKKMDELAEIGVAAHWKYKSSEISKISDDIVGDNVKWLRELVEILKSDERDSNEMLELLKIDLFQDEIFVFTPGGDVLELKENSTPLDFAFAVHSEVGMKCKGAKVNGKIVPLNMTLNNGDKIEIITSSKQTPNQAWLKIVQTTKAKTRIKRYLKHEEEKKHVELGKEMLEKSLRKIKKYSYFKEIEKNPEKIGFNNIDIVYSEIAQGKIIIKDLLKKFNIILEEEHSNKDLDSESYTQKFINRARGIAKGVKVGGITNTLIYFPKCCSPIPGDEIIGYVTRGKGVTIHRSNCTNVPISKEKERFIDVEWEVNRESSFLVRLKIVFEDRKHLLKNLTESTSLMDINIKSVDIKEKDGMAVCYMVIEVKDSKQLTKLKNTIIKAVQPQSIERI